MVNDGGGDVGEREPVGAPAIAELLVLGGRARNGRREAADGAKQVGCEREVVRREERLARASGAIVFVDELLDLLAGRRIGIFGKRVLDAPAEQPAIVQFDLAHEGGEPVGGRCAIVVDEREKQAPGDGRSRARLADQPNVESVRIGGNEGVERFGAAIVDDDDLDENVVASRRAIPSRHRRSWAGRAKVGTTMETVGVSANVRYRERYPPGTVS